jgi:uroporphyrinogen III methyltransferase/synthase
MPDDVSLAGIRVMVTRPSGDWSILREGPICEPTPAENMDLSPSAAQRGQSHFRGGEPDSVGHAPVAAKIGTVPIADPLTKRLRELGAEVLVQPAIRISPPPDWRPVDDALAHLSDYDWLVFSSANGVRALLERGRQTNPERRDPAFPCLAAIGPGTADELARYGLQADLVPEQFRAESLAEALVNAEKGNAEKGTDTFCRNGPAGAAHKRGQSPFPLAGKRFLLARASRGREVLAERLVAAGAQVEQIVVYTSTDVEQPDAQIAALLQAGQVDWITVTSSAIARSLARLFGDDLRRAKLASISPLTSGVLRELGFEPAAEPAEYTLAGLAAAIAAKL